MARTHNDHTERSHLDVWDRYARERFAARIGVSDERLCRAVRVVGSRIATLSSYLKA